MKLQVRKYTHGGSTYIVLCDETGKILPGQTESKYETGSGKTSMLTVSFAVFGDVSFVDGEAIP